MNLLIWMYGGVHHDPGSRRRFIEELARQDTAPHFVAVEWEKYVFERFVACRPWVEQGLRSRWDFLTSQDRLELSLALAWEGDAYRDRFPGADPLWLETGFQEADFKRRCGAASPESFARGLLERLCKPCTVTMREFMANADPPSDPKSKKQLIDRVSRKMWSELLPPTPEDLERDKRWAASISERSSGLRGGWIAVVVGWAHADPAADNERLCGLLSSDGFRVNPVCLAP